MGMFLLLFDEAARGLCGGGSEHTFRPPPPPPHIPRVPPVPPLVAESRSTAGLADRAGTGDKGGREGGREEEEGGVSATLVS